MFEKKSFALVVSGLLMALVFIASGCEKRVDPCEIYPEMCPADTDTDTDLSEVMWTEFTPLVQLDGVEVDCPVRLSSLDSDHEVVVDSGDEAAVRQNECYALKIGTSDRLHRTQDGMRWTYRPATVCFGDGESEDETEWNTLRLDPYWAGRLILCTNYHDGEYQNSWSFAGDDGEGVQVEWLEYEYRDEWGAIYPFSGNCLVNSASQACFEGSTAIRLGSHQSAMSIVLTGEDVEVASWGYRVGDLGYNSTTVCEVWE